ncbi:MAG: hypothetical protein ACK5X3_18725 [Pseudomonadota bacterium]
MDKIALEASEVKRVPCHVNALRCLTLKTAPLKALSFFPAAPHVPRHPAKGEK